MYEFVVLEKCAVIVLSAVISTYPLFAISPLLVHFVNAYVYCVVFVVAVAIVHFRFFLFYFFKLHEVFVYIGN